MGYPLVTANMIKLNDRERTQEESDRFGGRDKEPDHPVSRLDSEALTEGGVKNQKGKEESFDTGAPPERCGQDPQKKGLGRKRKGREYDETPQMSTQEPHWPVLTLPKRV